MARPSKEPVNKTEWGTYLRTLRMKTQTEKGVKRGTWPLSMPAMAAWISAQLGRRIAPNTYTHWELGLTDPPEDVKAEVRKVLAKLPTVEEAADAAS